MLKIEDSKNNKIIVLHDDGTIEVITKEKPLKDNNNNNNTETVEDKK